MMRLVIIDNYNRSRRRSIINDYNRSRRRSIINDYNRNGRYYTRRRNRTVRIRCPRRRNRTHTTAAPNPSSMIPVPILITGNPSAVPPTIAIFRDHHLLNNYRCWRRLNYYSRGRSYNISLLRREKYVIKVAEKSVYPTGIFPVINMSPRDMSVITGTSGKKASCQCYRQNFYFIFYKTPLYRTF